MAIGTTHISCWMGLGPKVTSLRYWSLRAPPKREDWWQTGSQRRAGQPEIQSSGQSTTKAGRSSSQGGTLFDGECRAQKSAHVKSSKRNKYFWTALISQHTKSGRCTQALRTYEEMRKDGVEPSPHTFIALLKACSSLQDLQSGRWIHGEVVRSGFESDVYVGTMLVDFYAKCKSMVDARRAFEQILCRDVVSWNTILLGYIQMENVEEALQLYTRMQVEGVVPDCRTFVSALKACSILAASDYRNGGDGVSVKRQCLETVRVIHADVRNGKFESDVFVGNMLVDVYAKCGSLEDARCVFEKMPCRDVVSWNAMILGYAQMDKGEEALELYTRMQQEGVVPDGRTYLSALKACNSLADLGEKGKGDGMALKTRCLEAVRAIQADVVKGKFESDIFVGTMLVDVYAKCGSLVHARHAFEKLPRRDVVSWTAMIMGYAQMDKGEEALQLFTQMQQDGVVPNERTYVSALKACSSMVGLGVTNDSNGWAVKGRCLKIVRAIHTDIRLRKFESSVFVGTMLVDVYAKCGSLEDAWQVFEKMPQRTVVSWNAMILGYTQMDKGEEALQLFTTMQTEGVVPDDRTFVSALKACSILAALYERDGSNGIPVKKRCLETVKAIHANVREAQYESDVFVGNMLVDAYAKCGSLDDARYVFERMPDRSVIAWTAMICGYAQMDEGEVALDLYTRMHQEGVLPNERTYVGVLNACGSVAGLEKGREIHAQILNGGLDTIDCFVRHSLIDMYAKCGSMVDAQLVFDAAPTREIVGWNALIAGYAHQGESEPVFDLFHRMKEEDIQPDSVTFLGVLTVCNHVGLVDRGQVFLNAMRRDFGITPTIKHFTCMVDLLGRSGQQDKAMELVKAMPFRPDSAVWECVLGACLKWGDVELGKEAFECAVKLDKDHATAYILMSNIYAAANMLEEAKEIQAARVKSLAWKQPGWSRWTDTSGIAHVFAVGDQRHPCSQSICATLGDLVVKMKKAGYVSSLDSVLRDTPADDKDMLCGRSEKLAIAFALLKIPQGTTISVV